jgi:hypothetical protein
MDSGPSPLDTSRAPFRLAPGMDAIHAAREMEACFRGLAKLPSRVSQCFAAALACAGLDEGHPLVVAGRRIAADIDAGIGSGDANPYHNAQHFCEVLLGALCLAQLQDLAPRERALLLFAALMHDFHHDGHIVRNAPFRLERAALLAAVPYLAHAGVPEEEQEKIAALVLATDVVHGVPFACRCHRHHAYGEPRPEPPPDSGALAMLAEEPRLALLAVLLTEADVLPSVGLTVALGDESQARISREMGLSLGAADKLAFLEKVFGHFEVGRFFTPNLEAMKREMAARAARPAA